VDNSVSTDRLYADRLSIASDKRDVRKREIKYCAEADAESL